MSGPSGVPDEVLQDTTVETYSPKWAPEWSADQDQDHSFPSAHGTGKAGQSSNSISRAGASRQGGLHLFCRLTLLCTLLWPQVWQGYQMGACSGHKEVQHMQCQCTCGPMRWHMTSLHWAAVSSLCRPGWCRPRWSVHSSPQNQLCLSRMRHPIGRGGPSRSSVPKDPSH